MSVYRSFTLRGATGATRLATFQGREHLVIPVVALVEGVLFAHNASAPELVPAELIAKMPSAWNGRPVVIDHPVLNGAMVSASASPDILERELAGTLFNAHIVDGIKLACEAWIDVSRATIVGAKLEEMIERVKTNDPIEVSVGAIVVAEAARGVHNGKTYYAKWKELAPDHLALLSKGSIGACSIAMGCGVRAAHRVTEHGLEVEQEQTTMARSTAEMLKRMLAVFRGEMSEEDMTDRDMRRALDAAIRASVPGYLGIVEVAIGRHEVIYEAAPESSYLTMRRTFSVDDNGVVALNDDAVEVTAVTKYEPVTASETRAACGCQHGTTVAATTPSTQGEPAMNKTARVAALIASDKTAFTEVHRALLEGATEEQLAALEQAVASGATVEVEARVAPPATPAPVVAAPAAAPAEVTLSALVEKADPDTRAAFAALTDGVKAEKAAHIATLTASGRCTFSEAELTAKSLSELKGLVGLLGATAPTPTSKVVTFAGRGMPRTEPTEADGVVDAPPDLTAQIRAARGAK